MLMRPESWDLLTELNNLFGNDKHRATSRDDSKVEGGHWIPAVDIKEEADKLIFSIDVPGIDAKNIDISMDNNVLTIKGAREEVAQQEKGSYHRIERVKGRFYRRFALPDTADSAQISAKSSNGVLNIVISKKKVAQARKIEVEAEK